VLEKSIQNLKDFLDIEVDLGVVFVELRSSKSVTKTIRFGRTKRSFANRFDWGCLRRAAALEVRP